MKRNCWIALILALVMLLGACSGGTQNAGNTAAPTTAPGSSAAPEATKAAEQYPDVATAIMLPGIEGENPIFQMIVGGIKQACAELGAPEPKVVEGGDDWNAYGKYLNSLAESKLYDIIFTATDAMKYDVAAASAAYPDQKFALINGDLESYRSEMPDQKIPANVWGIAFDLYQLGYLGGYYCGLVTKSSMERANEDLVVGLVFTDVYDPWEIDLKTGFTNGVKDVDPNIEILNSIIGDWVDPQKGAAVARAMIAKGADIVYYTTGASAYGCVTEAAAQNVYAISSDNNSIHLDPKTIVGCTMVEGSKASYDAAYKAITGALPWGTTEAAGAKEGAVTFTFDDPVYLEAVPKDIQDAMQKAYQGLGDGSIDPRRPIS
ncbi:MAG: BMP family ABC transporter substrate-binding protein [Bacillota bacterium]